MLESAMSHISKPVDWEVYSIPPIQPVQYYSILKKQREFSQLVKQYDAQVFKHGFLHFCGIVPKCFNSLSNRYEIFIVFLDQSSSTSFIGFRVKVSKETFTYESKSLLLFLKNSEKAIFYSINNNRIHVHCGTNCAWELFYLLYDEYLKRYVLTIIGTRFFYHFVYSCCIEKEKQFLKWFYKGSRVIKVSKASVYYKIHRKRKISVTDLVYMTLNMPKRKKYNLPFFNSKEFLLHSDMENSDFYTSIGNKINISKLTMKKYRKQDFVPEKCSQKIMHTDVHKRKFGDDNVEQKFKFDKSHYTENKWKQFKKFKSYSIKNYSSISFINTLLPSLLENENSTVVQELCALRDHKEKDTNENYSEEALFKKESMTYSGCVIPKNNLSHHSTSLNDDLESHSCVKNSDLTKSCDIDPVYFSTKIKDMKNEDFATEDVNFTTAAGKSITVSSAAMLKAYKLCEKEQVLSEKTICDTNLNVPKKNYYSYSEKNPASTIPKISENKHLQTFSFPKYEENMPMKFTAGHSSNIEDLEEDDNFDVIDDVGFSNAAGKAITVSNTAIEAAKKLIYNVIDEEKALLHNENVTIQRNPLHKGKVSNNSCNSKSDDVDMDNTLVEKFFEDVHFDEKELELTGSSIMKDSLNTISESKNDKSLPTRKPRKSLGGRRSMRDCSNKL